MKLVDLIDQWMLPLQLLKCLVPLGGGAYPNDSVSHLTKRTAPALDEKVLVFNSDMRKLVFEGLLVDTP